jgi:hypothetical protein
MQPDVYAVQGYDTGLLLVQGANAVKGDLSKKPELYKAMEGAVIDSPRGKWTMKQAHTTPFKTCTCAWPRKARTKSLALQPRPSPILVQDAEWVNLFRISQIKRRRNPPLFLFPKYSVFAFIEASMDFVNFLIELLNSVQMVCCSSCWQQV